MQYKNGEDAPLGIEAFGTMNSSFFEHESFQIPSANHPCCKRHTHRTHKLSLNPKFESMCEAAIERGNFRPGVEHMIHLPRVEMIEFPPCGASFMFVFLGNSHKTFPNCDTPHIQGPFELSIHSAFNADKLLQPPFFRGMFQQLPQRSMHKT